MKLDNLTENERIAYDNWDLADDQGGDCDGIGYAWAAFDGYGLKDNEAILLQEDWCGFVTSATFSFEHREVFAKFVSNLQDADAEYEAENDEYSDEEDYDELVEENLA
jgi:hypothetical protein